MKKEERMKKIVVIAMMVILFLFLSESLTFARSQPSKNYLTLSFFINPSGAGYKHRVAKNLYLTGNLDYRRSIKDLECQAGAAYFIPKKILIFRFYGAAGLQFSRNDGYQYPYITIGSHFFFLYADICHRLQNRLSPKYRFGLSFSF